MSSKATLQYFGRDLEAMSFAENYHKWIVDEFRPYLGDSVAEIGAGTGNFSKFLVAAEIKSLVAFEPSGNMYPLLKEHFKNNKKVDTVPAFLKDAVKNYQDSFDSVVYVNVLEHVEDDEKELSYVFAALKEKGHLLLFVPALSWLYSKLDRNLGHYRRYHKNALAKLVQNAGFSIVKVKYFDFVGILPWFIAFVLLQQSITGDSVALYDKFVVPVMRVAEGVISPPIGKNLLLVGKKNGRRFGGG